MITLPPQSIEAEMSILGGVLLENGAMDRALGIISPNDLYREPHRKILRAMFELNERNEPCDLITLTAILQEKGELQEVGGAAYLATLIDFVPTSANIHYYAKIVKEKATLRRVQTHLQKALGEIGNGAGMDAVMPHVEAAADVQLKNIASDPADTISTLRETFNQIDECRKNKGKLAGHSYGLADLDKPTGGYADGELVIIAGRPSMGKTTFAMNIAEAACDQKLSVLIFSLEMSRTNLMQKILASQARTQYQNIRSGRLESVEYARLEKASERIQGWQLRIDDTPGLTFPELRGKARKLKRTGLDVIVIDYLQLLQLPSGSNRVHALGEVSRGLKTLARELKITVFALSQLNRSVDGRDDKRPRMSDLRDSGELEQDGDTIIFPYRPAAYCQLCRDNTKTADHDPREHQALAEIIIEKQRNGERNISIPAVWLGAYQRFTDKVVDVF